MILGFIQGNFSSSPFKAISDPADAVSPIDQGRVTTREKDVSPVARPTLASFMGAASEDEFVALAGEVDTLADRPNHLFVHPKIFTRADGPRTMPAKSLACALIRQLNRDPTNASSSQEKTEVEEERDKQNGGSFGVPLGIGARTPNCSNTVLCPREPPPQSSVRTHSAENSQLHEVVQPRPGCQEQVDEQTTD